MKKNLILIHLILVTLSCDSPKSKPHNVLIKGPQATKSKNSDPKIYKVSRETLENIVGTWISIEDTKAKLIITNNKFYSCYIGYKTDTSSYSVSNTSPQCGVRVPVDSNTNYVKTIDDNDTTFKMCYEIEMSSTRLSLRMVDRGQPSAYRRQ